MIKFKKKTATVLPYNRKQYLKRTKENFLSLVEWFGVTFQLPGASEGKDIGLIVFVKHYVPLFHKMVAKLDDGSFWVVNHDDKDWEWFPNNENNTIHLRNLFKQHNIPNSFKGAIIFSSDELLKFSKALISYPYTVINKKNRVYSNLDISHGELPIIIKTDGHWGINILSTNKELLREIVNQNSTAPFIVKQYRGSPLW